MKKHFLCALALALCVSACGAPPLPSPTPRVSATPAPPAEELEFALPCYAQAGFHPITGTNRTNLTLAPLLYEGLYALDATFTPVPLLCQSAAVSADSLVWTFTLRPEATFSDGSPVTPRAAAASLRLAQSSTRYGARLSGVQSVTASDEALVVALSAPNGALPALLDIPIVAGEGDRPLGSGAYVLTGEGEALTLAAQPHWWQQKSLPQDAISLRAIQEAEDLIYAFDTRDVTLVRTDLTGTNALGFSGGYETIDFPTSTLLFVGYNTQKGLCRDAALRRALNRGLDRGTVASVLLARHARPSTLPVPPGTALYDAALAQTFDYAPAALAEQLDAAGWRSVDGVRVRGRQTLSLRLLVSQENRYKMGVADFLAGELQAAGVAITVEKRPWDAYEAALRAGDFDLYLGETQMTGDFDLTPFLAPGGALNPGGYGDAETDTCLATLRAAQGAARAPAAHALYARLGETVPLSTLCFKNGSVLTQWGRIAGLAPTQQNLFYGFTDWKIK